MGLGFKTPREVGSVLFFTVTVRSLSGVGLTRILGEMVHVFLLRFASSLPAKIVPIKRVNFIE